MKKIPKKLKTIGRCLPACIAAVCILCVVLMCYTAVAKAIGNPLPTVFGWGGAVVVSGSMEPELPVGALVWIHKQDVYSPGDVVTYEENGSLVTHRLISVQGDTAITKGDANNTEDSPIAVTQICGKVAAVWYGAGNIMLFLRSPAVILMIILFSGLIIFLPKRFNRKEKNEHETI